MTRQEWVNKKIYTREELIRQCNIWRYKGKRIVFTNGCFDILHHGHLDILTKAADLGDILIVGLNTDQSVKRLKGEERPVNNEADRAFQLASLLYVDAVSLFDEDTPKELIEALNPDILVKGGDYTADKIAGAQHVLANGGKVEIIPLVQGYSTTGIIANIKKL